jgi:hypothetical protein
MNRITARPSPALIVAVVALVAALAGTAIAGPGASSSAITKAKVKKVANKQINKQKPWQTADIADGAITTAKLAAGAVTSPKLATINTRESSVTATDNYVEATANCNSGEKVLSGGYKDNVNTLAVFNIFPFEDHKQGEGWYVRAFISGTFTLTVEAYCLTA